jgi:carboxylesterase type B
MKYQVNRQITRLTICGILSILLGVLGSGALMAAMNQPVRTQSGLLSGVPGRSPSVTVYKGVPYAAPPVGKLRWRAPQPPVAWHGVRKADRFGSICPQTQRGKAVPTSEDCLFLNIWTEATSAAERRPVFVWFYGGRFTGGAGSDPTFDGEGLARKGLVVVTMNYRTGAFGFLATPELSKESGHNASGNYGLLDQIACLKWLRKNIAAFGGDPSRVTIAGQSAGAGSVLLLSNSPLAKGLYQRAIAQSGARFPNDPALRGLAESWRSLKSAESSGVKYGEALGAHSLKELRALSWEKLLEGNNDNDNSVSGNPPPPLFRPVVDGWVIPLDYSQTYARGLQNDVPFMTGYNLDEGGATPQPNVSLDYYLSEAIYKYGAMADEFLKLYPASSDQEAGLASNAASRDESRVSTFLWAVDWKKAAKSPVFTYFWTHAPPGSGQGQMMTGAYHGSEINYVFDNLYATDRPWTDEDSKIADTMSSYWANFAANGDPNDIALPVWPAFDPKSPTVMELGSQYTPIPVADNAKLDFIRRFFETQQPW